KHIFLQKIKKVANVTLIGLSTEVKNGFFRSSSSMDQVMYGPKEVHCLTRDFSPCLCHGSFQRQVSSAFSLHMAWIIYIFIPS
ncbi:hypothetical protein C0J52_18740, partial [Blattella germanica]